MIGLQKKNYDFLPLRMPGLRVFLGANHVKWEKSKNSF